MSNDYLISASVSPDGSTVGTLSHCGLVSIYSRANIGKVSFVSPKAKGVALTASEVLTVNQNNKISCWGLETFAKRPSHNYTTEGFVDGVAFVNDSPNQMNDSTWNQSAIIYGGLKPLQMFHQTRRPTKFHFSFAVATIDKTVYFGTRDTLDSRRGMLFALYNTERYSKSPRYDYISRWESDVLQLAVAEPESENVDSKGLKKLWGLEITQGVFVPSRTNPVTAPNHHLECGTFQSRPDVTKICLR